MDTRTGEIKYLTEMEAARAALAQQQGARPHRDRLVRVPDDELHEVHGMNRHERRRWAAQKRRDERKRLREAKEAAAKVKAPSR